MCHKVFSIWYKELYPSGLDIQEGGVGLVQMLYWVSFHTSFMTSLVILRYPVRIFTGKSESGMSLVQDAPGLTDLEAMKILLRQGYVSFVA